jgi:hypothetical protein
MTNEFKYEDEAAKTLSPIMRKQISEHIKDDINNYCVKTLTDGHRNHLGASVIGMECHRALWYVFRWVKFQIFEGRMLRLFERGTLEEKRIIGWLKGIGCEVWEVDNDGRQFRIWGVKGHYGGSADSVGILPYFPDLPILLEFKTHNTKSFSNLTNKGLLIAKPQHYSQMCSYGKHYNFKYGLYIAVNKNDDDLHIELVELDWRLAHDLTNKAQDIIEAKFPPPRISDQPAYWECKYCSFHGICHNNEPVEVNCRSCKNATAIENAKWFCEKYQLDIPESFIKEGCPDHVSINK